MGFRDTPGIQPTTLTVAENIVLAWNRDRHGCLERPFLTGRLRQRAASLLEELADKVDPDSRVADLSVGNNWSR